MKTLLFLGNLAIAEVIAIVLILLIKVILIALFVKVLVKKGQVK